MICSRIGLVTGVTASIAAFGGFAAHGAVTQQASVRGRSGVRVGLRAPVIDLYHSASISVSGLAARNVEVRLLGAIDRTGLAYEWTPYRWQRLRLRGGTWHGVLPPPALLGIYRLQLRIDNARKLSSPRWLLRVFPPGVLRRPPASTAAAAVRHFVTHLPGDQVLVALRRWSRASFDHRDPRLHRLFVIAYEPRGDHRSGSRLGLFVTAVRDGYHGGWRVLEATAAPYD